MISFFEVEKAEGMEARLIKKFGEWIVWLNINEVIHGLTP
jgi:hypothetical protein